MSVNQVLPLTTLNELTSWEKPASCAIYNEALNLSNYTRLQGVPLTLVCHDMKNGYLDDKFVNGTSNKDAYRFYHWTGVDIFVYFSHNFVTIPPLGWIKAAHLHGVRVLGTFITEWEKGAEICRSILCDKSIIKNVVSKLVEISKFYKFEGWLLNIENEISKELIPSLLFFIECLKTSMKEGCSDSLVLWYDSVTKEGKLEWQNQLNFLNNCFFDISDGIFLNYTWKANYLKKTKEVAGVRGHDVFVGIDVFGRNFYKGGKFNTYKALKVARNVGLSVAIFAQGWTYEVLGKEHFVSNDNLLWKSFSPFLFIHGPNKLPFVTSFCQGYGEKFYISGEAVKADTWHNLSLQHYQPIWIQQNQDAVLSIQNTFAFNGGGCLEAEFLKAGDIRLFECSFRVISTLNITVVAKHCDVSWYVVLLVENNLQASNQIFLNCSICNDERESTEPYDCIYIPTYVNEINGWTSRLFHIKFKNYKIKQVKIQARKPAKLYLGYLEIK